MIFEREADAMVIVKLDRLDDAGLAIERRNGRAKKIALGVMKPIYDPRRGALVGMAHKSSPMKFSHALYSAS